MNAAQELLTYLSHWGDLDPDGMFHCPRCTSEVGNWPCPSCGLDGDTAAHEYEMTHGDRTVSHNRPSLKEFLVGESIREPTSEPQRNSTWDLAKRFSNGSPFRNASVPSLDELMPYKDTRECYLVAEQLEQKWPHLKQDAGFYVRPKKGAGDHAWNIAPDGTIVDMTATQFGKQPHVIPPNHPMHKRYVSWTRHQDQAQTFAHNMGWHDDPIEACPQCNRGPDRTASNDWYLGSHKNASVMYHVAPKRVRENIESEGLRPQAGADDPQAGVFMVPRHPSETTDPYFWNPAKDDVWEVNTEGLDIQTDPWGKLYSQPNYLQDLGGSFYTPSHVESERLRRLDWQGGPHHRNANRGPTGSHTDGTQKVSMAVPLYHVSSAANREAIQKHGLMGHDVSTYSPWKRAYAPPGNYFFDHPENARNYAYILQNQMWPHSSHPGDLQEEWYDHGIYHGAGQTWVDRRHFTDEVFDDDQLDNEEHLKPFDPDDPNHQKVLQQLPDSLKGYDIWHVPEHALQNVKRDPESALTQGWVDPQNAQALQDAIDSEGELEGYDYEPLRYYTPEHVPPHLLTHHAHIPGHEMTSDDEEQGYGEEHAWPDPFARTEIHDWKNYEPGVRWSGKLSAEDYYYHYAPTGDRARVRQHGLQPSNPNISPTWDHDMLPQQPQGVYVSEDPSVFGPWNFMGQKVDLWRFPRERAKSTIKDPLVPHTHVIPHPIQDPELVEPYEHSELAELARQLQEEQETQVDPSELSDQMWTMRDNRDKWMIGRPTPKNRRTWTKRYENLAA